MREELLDVVDEHDQPVERRSRSEIHRLGLKHRAVHVLLYNRAGDLFLQKRSRQKDCDPGRWDSSASGHLDASETYDACAARELREELGLAPPSPLERWFKVAARPETGQEFVWVYRGQAEGPFELDAREIDEGRWLEPAALDRWLEAEPAAFSSAFRWIWAQIRR